MGGGGEEETTTHLLENVKIGSPFTQKNGFKIISVCPASPQSLVQRKTFFFHNSKNYWSSETMNILIVVDILHALSLPMTSMTSHSLTSEIKIDLTTIQLQHLLDFITNFK